MENFTQLMKIAQKSNNFEGTAELFEWIICLVSIRSNFVFISSHCPVSILAQHGLWFNKTKYDIFPLNENFFIQWLINNYLFCERRIVLDLELPLQFL